jgi:hypothetical protein
MWPDFWYKYVQQKQSRTYYKFVSSVSNPDPHFICSLMRIQIMCFKYRYLEKMCNLWVWFRIRNRINAHLSKWLDQETCMMNGDYNPACIKVRLWISLACVVQEYILYFMLMAKLLATFQKIHIIQFARRK